MAKKLTKEDMGYFKERIRVSLASLDNIDEDNVPEHMNSSIDEAIIILSQVRDAIDHFDLEGYNEDQDNEEEPKEESEDDKIL